MQASSLRVLTAVAAAAAIVASGAHAAAEVPAVRRTLAVVSCDTTFGTGGDESTPPPKRLPVSVPARVARRLTYYSNDRITFLAPKGWGCEGLVGADGSEQLQAYPKGKKPAVGGKVGESVLVVADYTGHGPGAQLVCPYFPDSAAAHFFGDAGPECPSLPEGRIVEHHIDDLANFSDAVGTKGEVVYPQVSPEPTAGVPVTYAECTLRGARKSLCTPILDDVLARRTPTPSPG